MKRVLYVTNIEVPYKVRLLNELAKYCDLTVLYERKQSTNRNHKWVESEKINYRKEYLNGINIKNEYSFSFRIFKYIFSKYDTVIISCYNSPVQMMTILILRLLHKPYILSTDGEIFIRGKVGKTMVKKFFLRGAQCYLAAGDACSESIKSVVGNKKIIPYYFSSLNQSELSEHEKRSSITKRNNTILVVGQYYDYKGLDIALEAARMDQDHIYKFVGMGKRTELFRKEQKAENILNVEIIPFLTKEELEKEYLTCRLLLLPSRQECWGLVVNEAASFGTPIVSTWGSGAAVEFLARQYPQYLAVPGNAESLYRTIEKLIESDHSDYERFLKSKSLEYNIEHMVVKHMEVIGKESPC